MELLHADKDSGHMLVANAAIPLQTILREEPTQFTTDSDPKGKLCSRLSTHLKLPLLSVQRLVSFVHFMALGVSPRD